eukprot:Skav220601  [mRNA]  locus=scaffold507:14010:18610:- [translate_table: standard]
MQICHAALFAAQGTGQRRTGTLQATEFHHGQGHGFFSRAALEAGMNGRFRICGSKALLSHMAHGGRNGGLCFQGQSDSFHDLACLAQQHTAMLQHQR